MADTVWKRSACPYDCPDACGLLMETDKTTVYRVKGDSTHPETCGFICSKMQHYEQTIHHPDRILTPLKRTGAKGDGTFEAISWDEALQIISDRWKKIIDTYGSEAILPYSYAGTEHLIQNKCGEAFFHRLGASKLERTICSMAKTEGFQQIIGTTRGINPSEMMHSDMIIIWGANIRAISVHIHAQLVKAKKRGVPIYLIETYQSPTAQLAKKTLLIQPGTDGALALCMAGLLKKYHMLDQKFIRQHCTGSKAFLQSLKTYSLKWAQDQTGISKQDIKELTKAYGRAKAPLIIFGSGMSRHGNGAMTTRCIAALPALVGAYARKGGGIWGNIRSSMAFDTDLITRPDFAKKPLRKINMNQLGSALKGYVLSEDGRTRTSLDPPVKSLYVYNSNPADVAPAQKQVLEGFMREDLFMVVHERFMTDTARFADIILPADTSAEHCDIAKPYGHSAVQKINPVITPVGESKSNWDTFALLAKAMGFEETYFSLSCEEICDQVLSRDNRIRNRWDQAQQHDFLEGKGVHLNYPDLPYIGTPDHKIHFVDPSLKYPMPVYLRHYGGKYPLKLIVAPSILTLNSTFNERQDLVDRRGRAVLKINPKDAYQRGIADGNIIEAYNDLAAVEIFADVSDAVPEGVAVAEGIYKLDQTLNELTVNALLSERLTDAGRASTLCDNTIDIRKI